MQTIQDITEEILRSEGGFVNDPDDPGGATNHGVTIHTMRRLGLDLTGDGAIDVADVRALGRAQAGEIFQDHYFYGPRINMLPEPLQASVYDMYVNAGSNAVKILQRLLEDMGYDIAADGVIGPQTARTAFAAFEEADAFLVDAYGIARRNYYYGIGDRRPASRKYARRRNGGKGGWITRAEKFMDPQYHLTNAEHANRVRKWV
jgi:lysozyme family protein